jgi:signal transduction histidine kinase
MPNRSLLNKLLTNKPFYLSRRRLAAWYTGIMALILIGSGLVVRQTIVHARWINLLQEMQILSGVLKDYIEPILAESKGAIYLADTDCQGETCLATHLPQVNKILSQAAYSNQLATRYYCVRLFNDTEQVVASYQYPLNHSICNQPNFWHRRQDSNGTYYHVGFYPLYIHTDQSWGGIQIAASLNALDRYLMRVEIALVVMVLLGIGLTGLASWWLAGLAMRPIGESYRQMQQFTADAAHELRTPLASLRAIVQTALRSEDLTVAETQATLQIFNRQTQRLSKLVQDLLILSQVDQAPPNQAFTTCHLNLITQEVVDEFMALAMAADLSFKAEIPSQPIYTFGNPEQIHRAIANLVGNAIKYTSKGGIILSLSQDQAALIQVRDTGIGIAPAEQAHIFERFYRVDRGRSRQQGGSGLGLAITSAIVQAHGGTLTVQSQLQQGSVFSLRLPLLEKPPSD